MDLFLFLEQAQSRDTAEELQLSIQAFTNPHVREANLTKIFQFLSFWHWISTSYFENRLDDVRSCIASSEETTDNIHRFFHLPLSSSNEKRKKEIILLLINL